MARETVEDKSRDGGTGSGEADEQPSGAAGDAGEPGGKALTTAAGKGRSRDSGTAAAAAQARAVMQRRHRRLGFAMTAAVGVEVAGAAGLVVAGMVPWEWGERLWGRTDTGGLVLQVAIAVTVLALTLGWLPARSARSGKLRPAARTVALLPAAVVVVGGVAMVWQAEPGSRGSGPVVAGLAALLVLAGAVSWLIGLRRLRRLFPFGLQDARTGGFGNLPAVRRAMLVGGPAGAVGGIAVVAGALLVVPGLVTTEDSQTAGSLALAGAPPATGTEPAWELSLDGDPGGSIRATLGGLVVDEPQGVRVVDPRDGAARWHWRDEAYQRVTSVVTDRGQTVVLALRYDGEQTGRDRVVALDTATGEVRWDQFDDDLVAAMGLVAVAPQDGDWFVVPEQGPPAAQGQTPAPVGLRAVGSDGATRWQADAPEGCNLTSVNADAGEVVVVGHECADSETAGCQVSGLDPATGEAAWTWPAGEPATGCQATPRPDLVFVNYQAGSGPAAVALDPATGAEVWALTEGPVTDLSNPLVIGDAVLGARQAESGTASVLVIREAADGQVRQEVTLPDGQPIEIVATRDGFAAISHYRPESAEVVLLEIDVAAGAVSSELVVATSPTDAVFQRVTIAVGPQTLAVDALLARGLEQGTEDYTLQVYGFTG